MKTTTALFSWVSLLLSMASCSGQSSTEATQAVGGAASGGGQSAAGAASNGGSGTGGGTSLGSSLAFGGGMGVGGNSLGGPNGSAGSKANATGGMPTTGGTTGVPSAGGQSSVGGSGTGGSTASTGTVAPEVGLYRTFELTLDNPKSYANKFVDVDLRASYTSPSGKVTDFIGFFDGDGKGGGNKSTGTKWKLRFMPNELGVWNYQWSWSDGTAGGKGTFASVPTGAGKGILRPYKDNPRWFAYNGTDPVYLKSYYETGHGSISQPLDWVTSNVYQTLLDNGYNHLQVNWLLPLCCETQYYGDGPAQATKSIRLYQEGMASSTMQFNVWKMMEDHVRWLNDRNVGLHMFLGFDGGRNDGPDWTKLSDQEKDFYVRYVVARLAPYANIAGWNFVWEVDGSRTTHELGWARLVQKHDVFNHLRTYEDETPKNNEYARPEYTFAAIENHLIFSSNKDTDRPYWKSAWTHHEASLAGYVAGKPVYMSEGNALWRRYWAAKTGATQDDLRQSAWATVTAAASFCWNGHASEDNLMLKGPEGLPFFGDDNLYKASAKAIDILTSVMTKDVVFSRMTPQDALLSSHDKQKVWSLAEPGQQYLVFSIGGAPFSLSLTNGNYTNNRWVDTKTGTTKTQSSIQLTSPQSVAFTPPDTKTDWVLLLRGT